MGIMPGIEIKDLALYLSKEDILIVADLHIGFEESLNKQGILVPRFQFKDLVERLQKVLNRKYKLIIVNGDIKHEFGEISDQEWRETLKVMDLLSRHADRIILLRGNHDTIIGPIANKRGVEIRDCVHVKDILVLHGNKLLGIPKGVKTIIIGHEHPAILLREPGRQERFKCFLKGTWKGKNLIVMPSYNPVVEGSDVLSEKMLSPFLQQNIGSFEVFIVEDKVYSFGKISRIRKLI
jgi:putative SbcD/Mre11-related phosphoesterase